MTPLQILLLPLRPLATAAMHVKSASAIGHSKTPGFNPLKRCIGFCLVLSHLYWQDQHDACHLSHGLLSAQQNCSPVYRTLKFHRRATARHESSSSRAPHAGISSAAPSRDSAPDGFGLATVQRMCHQHTHTALPRYPILWVSPCFHVIVHAETSGNGKFTQQVPAVAREGSPLQTECNTSNTFFSRGVDKNSRTRQEGDTPQCLIRG